MYGAVQGGSLRLIAIASPQRLPTLPDLPTFAETLPGFQSQGWLALMAPAGTPDAIVKKVNADLAAVIELPEVKEKFAALGTFSRVLSPAQTGEFIRSEEEVVVAGGARPRGGEEMKRAKRAAKGAASRSKKGKHRNVVVTVNDKMQRGYRYVRSAPVGPQFRCRISAPS